MLGRACGIDGVKFAYADEQHVTIDGCDKRTYRQRGQQPGGVARRLSCIGADRGDPRGRGIFGYEAPLRPQHTVIALLEHDIGLGGHERLRNPESRAAAGARRIENNVITKSVARRRRSRSTVDRRGGAGEAGTSSAATCLALRQRRDLRTNPPHRGQRIVDAPCGSS